MNKFLILFTVSLSFAALCAPISLAASSFSQQLGLHYPSEPGQLVQDITRTWNDNQPYSMEAEYVLSIGSESEVIQLVLSETELDTLLPLWRLRVVNSEQVQNSLVMGLSAIVLNGVSYEDNTPLIAVFLPWQGKSLVITCSATLSQCDRFINQLGMPTGFSDTEGHPLVLEIQTVIDQGIFKGYQDPRTGKILFRPEQTINRAELLKVLVLSSPGVDQEEVDQFYIDYRQGIGRDDLEAVSDNDDETRPILHDVDREAWFAPYIFYAYDQGWIQGYDDGSFRPASAVNIAETAKMILSARHTMLEADPEIWFRPFFDYLEGQSILTRSDDRYQFRDSEVSFFPYEECSRGVVAGFLGRLLEKDRQ